MQSYAPPIDDYRFLLNDVLGFDQAMAELGKEVDADLAVAVLEEAGKVCAERLQPLNREGDEQGSRLVDGAVQTPDGFAQAYRDFAEGGWTSLSADPAHGGQGLPFVLQLWFDEMMSATNLSFGLFPGLSRGACEAIAAHASDELKATYLEPLVSGEWTGAMALTESGAGTDLALLKTRATPKGDGSYAVAGTKIFISSGDHDFGGNIVHLVLARLPDAPPGVKGISLFLVPKFLPDADGGFTVRNAMSVGSLEKKMGIHAQPTCVMHYDDATGWLVGEAHRGLAAMFTMMNAERLMVGIQGLGIAGGAYQQAVAYARDRLQGRSADGARGPVAIIEHADVRRMLLNVRAFVEAGRALAGWTALQLDRAKAHADAGEREQADALVALLTPVIKAAFTDYGFECAVQAQQVFGGHGYIREWGMEQFVRDARIAQIYEGTNGVQAMDLVGRKLPMAGGAVVEGFFDGIAADVAAAGDRVIAVRTGEALALLREATVALRGADVDATGAAAVDYLRLFALVAMGWMWTRMAVAAGSGETALHQGKLAVADYYARRVLPQASGLAASIAAGEGAIMALAAEAF
ncbi:MAG: acyl-CoA dehydrogenase [Sphingobium sp.]|jgi:alkylation response protein AidB-like acyl-CoA dehydrogenase|uniref:acyl-CoA dehydrogenase family protein n=1 Tax=Sphingomonadales TaxID=204457 RepID=UPI0011FE9F3E|nr:MULTISPECIES: acyl-CoA dehydrogenase family protein [Sphingomonadaceae]MBU0659849.1 acyl-CoA dehydrogenase C-terminal domain-containing protein [Alphaproteobacteria bacterium]MBA4756443.1 acyl-CoA dehydrogenase C-terminal domain-containing protein [Sphingobium sp.]MBA4762712.1 acyl-CoA dehydrogenase C-terminal domain-containing protein [Sphingomonas sp.]MBU0774108.1 acyl-CoA dehydrogenase C-terminal domain-containing protein [Alphaproteobacteria bacterium]MBU0867725.1 acyl-CoA dehydrogenase